MIIIIIQKWLKLQCNPNKSLLPWHTVRCDEESNTASEHWICQVGIYRAADGCSKGNQWSAHCGQGCCDITVNINMKLKKKTQEELEGAQRWDTIHSLAHHECFCMHSNTGVSTRLTLFICLQRPLQQHGYWEDHKRRSTFFSMWTEVFTQCLVERTTLIQPNPPQWSGTTFTWGFQTHTSQRGCVTLFCRREGCQLWSRTTSARFDQCCEVFLSLFDLVSN